MNTTSPTASSATRIISSATIRLRTKPRVSVSSWAAFSDHITVCMAPLSDHSANTAPTAIMTSLLSDASSCVMLARTSASTLSGTTPLRWSSSVCIDPGPTVALNTPTASSSAEGMARKPLKAIAWARCGIWSAWA